MNISMLFTDEGNPSTGKSPVITIWTLDGTMVVNAQAMTEVAGGFYYYTFTAYDNSVDYVLQGYESTLPVGEQYVSGSNAADASSEIETSPILNQILGLGQSNFVMSGQTYDETGRLLTSDMYTYATPEDTVADTNREYSYTITSEYDENGNLTKYTVIEI